MPRLKRRQLRRTGWHLLSDQICWGYDWFGELTDEDREAAWHARKDDVLPRWIEQRPGTRPPHWWKFDSPGEREFFGTEVVWDWKYNVPPAQRIPITGAWQGMVGVRRPALETEERFLRRHSLLSADERQALERMDLNNDQNEDRITHKDTARRTVDPGRGKATNQR